MKKFEPFQKVLVRDNESQQWVATLFSNEMFLDGITQYMCAGVMWEYCIPYEGNEHLLGTPSSPTESEFKFGDRVEVSYDQETWLPAIFYKIRASHHRAKFCVLRPTGTCSWPYCRKADC